jgi:hypothetical protein
MTPIGLLKQWIEGKTESFRQAHGSRKFSIQEILALDSSDSRGTILRLEMGERVWSAVYLGHGDILLPGSLTALSVLQDIVHKDLLTSLEKSNRVSSVSPASAEEVRAFFAGNEPGHSYRQVLFEFSFKHELSILNWLVKDYNLEVSRGQVHFYIKPDDLEELKTKAAHQLLINGQAVLQGSPDSPVTLEGEDENIYKYVRLKGDLFRFLLFDKGQRHDKLIAEGERIKVISAGTICVLNGIFSYVDGKGAQSLDVSCLEDDVQKLEVVLQLKHKDVLSK